MLSSSQPLPILYASTSGNTEWVVDQVSAIFAQQQLSSQLFRSEQTDAAVWTSSDIFVLATSTWEHGELNPFFKKLFDALEQIDCHGKQAAFIGLGDVRYEPVLFCGGMEQLQKRWLERGGKRIGRPLKINGEPFSLLESTVRPWAVATAQLINNERSGVAVQQQNGEPVPVSNGGGNHG